MTGSQTDLAFWLAVVLAVVFTLIAVAYYKTSRVRITPAVQESAAFKYQIYAFGAFALAICAAAIRYFDFAR
ncbi:MAG: hypothetical protein Q8R08_01130 [bacterium]|nr:hypothetical protein [bacterium]